MQIYTKIHYDSKDAAYPNNGSKMSTAHRKSILLSTLVLGLNGASVADFNRDVRALCASHEKSGHYRQKENVNPEDDFQLFSVSR